MASKKTAPAPMKMSSVSLPASLVATLAAKAEGFGISTNRYVEKVLLEVLPTLVDPAEMTFVRPPLVAIVNNTAIYGDDELYPANELTGVLTTPEFAVTSDNTDVDRG